MIYENAPLIEKDEGFELAHLAHLVIGNQARLLDPRRTPVKIVDLQKNIAAFSVEITAFEDKGAIWQLPLWYVHKFQFQKNAKRLPVLDADILQKLVDKYNRNVELEFNHSATASTLCKLEDYRRQADEWLCKHSAFIQQKQEVDLTSPIGKSSLQADLARWFRQFDLHDLDTQFADNYVSNPASTELIKGHRMVLADMGLCPYQGGIQRDPELFSGVWTREIRTLHILTRMAFVQGLFLRLGYEKLPLFRAIYSDDEIERPRNQGFVSTTFSSSVASSLFESGQTCEMAIMTWQKVPVKRLFMTHIETERLNQPYREAEAILLFDMDNPLF